MKRKFLLLAIILPFISFVIIALFSFKHDAANSITTEDSSSWYDAQEQDRVNTATTTMYLDGGPFGESVKAPKFYHYCCHEKWFVSRRARLNWIDEMMGPGNINHVHYIFYETGSYADCRIDGISTCYKATLKIWTNSPCSLFC